jgi:hypothetical protein
MSENIELKQTTTVADAGENSLGDFRVSVSAYIDEPFISLPKAEINLTAESAKFLITQLQSALELIGEDFLIHHNGDIAIWKDGESAEYKSLADYKADLETA